MMRIASTNIRYLAKSNVRLAKEEPMSVDPTSGTSVTVHTGCNIFVYLTGVANRSFVLVCSWRPHPDSSLTLQRIVIPQVCLTVQGAQLGAIRHGDNYPLYLRSSQGWTRYHATEITYWGFDIIKSRIWLKILCRSRYR